MQECFGDERCHQTTIGVTDIKRNYLCAKGYKVYLDDILETIEKFRHYIEGSYLINFIVIQRLLMQENAIYG